MRLAQRDYRQRKENAIIELESQVRDLKEANGEMRSALQRVFDSASNSRILAQVPELDQQLRQLQVLVKRSQNAEAKTEDNPEASTGGASNGTGRGSRQAASSSAPSIQDSVGVGTGHSPPERLHSGVAVTPQPVAYQQQLSCAYPVGEGAGNYQVIAAPTLDNASFATTASYVFTPTPASEPSVSLASSSFSPWSSLPMPASGAYAEHRFARRLHRFATEKAAYLICMRNPPPEKMMRVFGFARLFETTEQIRERTLAILARTRDQSLHVWNYPFHHLGNAGTHFPQHLSGGGGSANVDPGTRGFRFGPLDETSSQIRDSLLAISQNIRMPGLQGLFWDCEEVEWYMRQNGVVIPDLATDFCAVEVQAGCFQYPELHHDAHSENHPREASLPDDEVAAPPHAADSSARTAMGGSATWQYVAGTGDMSISSQNGFAAPHVSVVGHQYQQPGNATTSMGAPAGKVVQLDVTKFMNGRLLNHCPSPHSKSQCPLARAQETTDRER